MKSTKHKLKLFVGFPSYGGNGGIQAEVPCVRKWWAETILKIQADPRIEAILPKDVAHLREVEVTGKVAHVTIGDTPVTMVRNRFVTLARQAGADLLMMIDSDQGMMLHRNDPGHIDFWDAAFPFVYDRYTDGPVCIAAPYCGPPNGTENVYVFQWGNYGVRGDETRFSLDQYQRNEAARMTGIQECAALPTGAILFDLRCFDIIEPSRMSKRETLVKLQSGEITVEDAEWALRDGFFYYEWKDQYADQKASTEDVTLTRDISLACLAKHGYNPVHCAWDSWVGHWKPWNVSKPDIYGADQISANFRKVAREDRQSNERLVDVSQLTKLPANFGRKPVVIPDIPEVPSWKNFHQTPPEDIAALQELVKEVLVVKDKCRVLEVGTWLGNTAIAMADAGAEVHCVDTWKGTPSDGMGILAAAAVCASGGSPDAVYDEFLKRIGDRYQKSITPYRMESLVAAKACRWPKFDLIFLDADHAYEAVKADIEAWLPHLAEDGIICGHDYGITDFPGVVKAVDERFFKEEGGTLRRLGNSIWAVIPALEPAA